MSFASGLSSYVAQNIGARKLDRIGPGLKAGGMYSRSVSAIVFMMIYLPLANRIISLFLPAGSASGLLMSPRLSVHRRAVLRRRLHQIRVRQRAARRRCDASVHDNDVLRPLSRVVLSIALFYVIGNEHGIWMSWPIGWFLGSGLSVFFYKTGAWKKRICLHSNRSQKLRNERVSYRKTLFMIFSYLFLNNLPEFLQKELRRTRKPPIFLLSGRGFLHFIPVKLHFVKKDVPADRNLLWYKYSRQHGRSGQHRRVTASSIPADELQGRSFRNIKNNSSY